MPMTFFCPHCTSFGFAEASISSISIADSASCVAFQLSGVTHPREAVASHRRTGWL